MSPLAGSLLVVVAAVTVAALIVVAREHGIGFITRGLAREIRSIRAFDVMGCGIRLLHVAPAERPDLRVATFWVTAFFVPLVPLRRHIVRFLDPGLHEARWTTVETTPLDAREVARTYLVGWIGIPLLLIGPFVLCGLVPVAAEWLGRIVGLSRDLADVSRTFAMLVAGTIALLGVPWFAIALYRVLKWDRDRRRPGAAIKR